MKKNSKMTVGAAASPSQNAAVVVNTSRIEMLNLVKIELDDFDFDDVHENVEKLLVHFFGDDFNRIEKLVNEIKIETGLDYDDYDLFMELADEGKFKKWSEYCNAICSVKPEVAYAVLDLYFQKTMIPSPDIHNDLLIYAYIEDIQPLLN
jgi:hypothetical protein